MTPDLLRCDARSEVAKGAVHLAVALTAAPCLGYSACANAVRPTVRLKLQALFYFLIVVVESYQVYEHFSASGAHRR